MRPAYPSIFAWISTEISRKYGCTPVFLKICTQVSRKYGNHDVNKCKVVASEADPRALMVRHCSLTFAYFKSFPGLKYMAGPDWSRKFVKPMNIDFASKLYGSWPSPNMADLNPKLLVISDWTKLMKRRKNAQNQGNKLWPVKNRSRKDASAKAAHTVQLFLEKVFCGLWSRTIFTEVNKIKSSDCSVSV